LKTKIKMAKYKIEYDRETCIGTLACNSVTEVFWPKAQDSKVDLANSAYNEQTKKWELIIDEKDFEINKDAAEVCPVDAIVITKIEESQDTKKESVENREDTDIQNQENHN